MYKIYASDEKVAYDIGELAKMFVPADLFEVNLDGNTYSKNEQKRRAYKTLSEGTGKTLDWGILTGVRPTKLYSQLVKTVGGAGGAKALLRNEYFLSDSKIELLEEIFSFQEGMSLDESPKSCGVYIGIPFCPSRCLYCSFTSNVINAGAAESYVRALEKEITATARIMEREGLFAESVYIGGGTPTSLDDREFKILLEFTKEHFAGERTKEWTVECGRPDTITENKLTCIKECGATRISINPQTMKPETLKIIGRNHTPEEIHEAYALAKKYDFIINMDLICGLPGENPEDFEDSLKEIVTMNPANITVHTLAVKRASRLIEEDKNYAYKQADNVKNMLDIKTMYYPDENRLERIANVSNYEIYIDRIYEMIQRKEDGIKL